MSLKKIIFNTAAFILTIYVSVCCNSLKETSENTKTKNSLTVYLGGSKGGFIEEPDLDAVSGATNINKDGSSGLKFCAGLHLEHPLSKKIRLEGGFDLISHQQSVEYLDLTMNFNGQINLEYYRLSMPLTCNFGFFKKRNNDNMLFLKTGISLNYINTTQTFAIGNVPGFHLNKFAASPYFNITFVPLSYKRYSTGVFFSTSLLKGTKVFYDNTYHKNNTSGLLSTMELGCCFNIKF